MGFSHDDGGGGGLRRLRIVTSFSKFGSWRRCAVVFFTGGD